MDATLQQLVREYERRGVTQLELVRQLLTPEIAQQLDAEIQLASARVGKFHPQHWWPIIAYRRLATWLRDQKFTRARAMLLDDIYPYLIEERGCSMAKVYLNVNIEHHTQRDMIRMIGFLYR